MDGTTDFNDWLRRDAMQRRIDAERLPEARIRLTRAVTGGVNVQLLIDGQIEACLSIQDLREAGITPKDLMALLAI